MCSGRKVLQAARSVTWTPLERLQVKVNGLTESRHFVVCNGRRVPLHPTGTEGEYVAAFGFGRGRQLPAADHRNSVTAHL